MLEPRNLDKINTSFYPAEILPGMNVQTQPPHGYPSQQAVNRTSKVWNTIYFLLDTTLLNCIYKLLAKL